MTSKTCSDLCISNIPGKLYYSQISFRRSTCRFHKDSERLYMYTKPISRSLKVYRHADTSAHKIIVLISVTYTS